MKIVLKTISGKQHEVEVEASQTVHDIKVMMEAEYEAGSVRLVYKGTILQDDKTVEALQLAESDVVVITGKRRGISKPVAKAPESTSTTATTTASVSADAPTQPPAPSTTAPSAPPSDTTAPPSDTTAANAPPTIPTTTTTTAPQPPAPSPSAPPPSAAAAAAEGSANSSSGGATAPATAPTAPTQTPAHEPPAPTVDQSLVDNIVAMGFEDRTQVALALRAAYMNPDRAVEYLCSGIPPHLLRELAPVQIQTTAPTAPAPAPATPEANSVAELRAALNTIPQFDQIRAIFHLNQESMPVILQQIAQRYPQLYSQIQANPAAFLEIISEPSGTEAATAAAQPGQPGGGEHGAVFDPQQIMAALTDADRTAVSELVSLGGGMWDEQSAAIVYLSLQRNKELAASVLFEHGGVPTALMAALTAPHAHQGGDEEDEEDDGDETLDQSG